VRRLARRDHSEGEIREALLRADYARDEVEATLDRLREGGLLDEQAFAEHFARVRLQDFGLGRYRIRQALRGRGVAAATVEKGLAEALKDAPEASVLEASAQKYWRSHARDAPAVRVRKLWAFLIRKGFAPGLVVERLGHLWPEWKDALEGLESVGQDEDESRRS
jgi:regulatory protein